MHVTLLSPPSSKPVDREYNAGLGAGFFIGHSIRARILESLRFSMADPPFLTFGYIAAIMAKNGHMVTSSTEIPADGVVIIVPSLANFSGDMQAIQAVSANPNLRLIVAGHLASVRPHDFSAYADLVIIGEPESVIQSIDGDSIPEGVLASRLIENLDSLPFPKWDVFPSQSSRFSFAFPNARFAFVQASRSCPYTCGYCPYVTIGRYRRRSVKSVMQELEYLATTQGVSSIIFRDPIFTVNRKWVLEFCEALDQSWLSVRWECETRLDRLDVELLHVMKAAGLRSIKVGIESVDPSVLKQSNRVPVTLYHQEEIVTTCRELGISVVAFYVLGLPSDTEQTVRSTIDYAKRLNTDIARFHIFTPLPGTPLYDAVRNKIFETDWGKFDLFNVVFRHDHLASDKLLALKEYAYVSYYFRWTYLRALVRRVLRSGVEVFLHQRRKLG